MGSSGRRFQGADPADGEAAAGVLCQRAGAVPLSPGCGTHRGEAGEAFRKSSFSLRAVDGGLDVRGSVCAEFRLAKALSCTSPHSALTRTWSDAGQDLGLLYRTEAPQGWQRPQDHSGRGVCRGQPPPAYLRSTCSPQVTVFCTYETLQYVQKGMAPPPTRTEADGAGGGGVSDIVPPRTHSHLTNKRAFKPPGVSSLYHCFRQVAQPLCTHTHMHSTSGDVFF